MICSTINMKERRECLRYWFDTKVCVSFSCARIHASWIFILLRNCLPDRNFTACFFIQSWHRPIMVHNFTWRIKNLSCFDELCLTNLLDIIIVTSNRYFSQLLKVNIVLLILFNVWNLIAAISRYRHGFWYLFLQFHHIW